MSGIAFTRLATEYEDWIEDHLFGFVAEPWTLEDGSINLLRWECQIPGLQGTPWEGGVYKLRMSFEDDYPSSPPKCKFYSPLFHPNVYETGTVCSSIFDETKDWRPTFCIKEILMFIQKLLNEPNESQSVQPFTLNLYMSNRQRYNHLIRMQARWHCP